MAQPPNIILILTDDHGAWANACYGNSEVQTPNLDRLSVSGIQFNHAYTPTPVCSPARACLLTGKTPSQIGIHDWLEEADATIRNRNWLGDHKTLFHQLAQHGYQTGLSGKWHLGQSDQTPEHIQYYFGLPGFQGAHNETYTYIKNGDFVTLSGNKSAHITDHAIEFLETIDGSKPFFLNIGYIATHSPYEQQAHDPSLTQRYQESTFSDIPAYQAHPWVKNEGTTNHPTPQELRDRYIGYYASVTEIDTNIGRILDTLKTQDLLDNTIIIYTSDHGCAIGHHGFFGKGNSTRPLNMYETSLHIPLIMSGAGIESLPANDHYVDHYDTFRTICDLTGITLQHPQQFPGTSYADLLRGKSIAWEDTRYGEYGDLRMIRNRQWKLIIRYPDGPHELFDLVHGPAETINVFAEHPATVAQLRRKLVDFYAKYDDPQSSGLRVKDLPRHNLANEAWRDGGREAHRKH